MRKISGILMTFAVLIFLFPATSSASESPTEVYMKYVTVLGSARNLLELAPYVSEARVKELDGMSIEQQARTLKLLQAMTAKYVKVTGEQIEGSKAILTLTGVDPIGGGGAAGTVHMLNEGGAWKIEKESWSSSYK